MFLFSMLFTGRPFQSTLMFVGKAESLPLKELHSSRFYSQILD